MDTAAVAIPARSERPSPAIDPAVLAELRRCLPEDVRASIPANGAPAPTMGRTGMSEGTEILPGYTIERLLGAGGFGEVFQCNAPGNIKKAVKIVFGSLDEERADRERKSLERIRDVRHPFLIGLERVEVVNRQLVIVSELADRSLKDRYKSCRLEQRPGIPREELLRYLKDAAEALDFLYEKHTLQHLDVKPENLMLLGDHIKVGDFGLLKDLRDTQVSLVGGVTPLYAPPEVLDGRPSRYSDQYSLAVLYQEMLTGQMPFNGRTAAQLASQHMHSAPDMSALPMSDRYAVGKALSKSPAKRFETCREFVEALIHPPAVAKLKDVEVAGAKRTGDEEQTVSWDLMRSQPVQSRCLSALRQLADGTCPTVVIGVGGLGLSVLRAFQVYLTETFGVGANVPSIQLVGIDTDEQAFQNSELVSPAGRDEATLVLTPLRTSQDYRCRKGSFSDWLSRRWLFNVPRSKQTEGLRPLGRLAFVDHASKIAGAISSAIERARDEDSVVQSSETSKLSFDANKTRVIVVGSLLGGTSSGMLYDIGYCVRQYLSDCEDSQLIGVLLHGNVADARTGELAAVNSLAAFAELSHYSQDHFRFSGEHRYQASLIGKAPFDATYAVHLGDTIGSDETDAAIDRVATYLVGNTLGQQAGFFDAARQNCVQQKTNVRGFGAFQLAASSGQPLPGPDALCDSILAAWETTCRSSLVYGADTRPPTERPEEIEELAIAQVAALRLPNLKSPEVRTQLTVAESACEPLIRQAIREASGIDVTGRGVAIAAKIDSLIAGTDEEPGQAKTLRARLEELCDRDRVDRLRHIRETIFTPPNAGAPRLADSVGTLFAIVRALVAQLETVSGQAQRTQGEAVRLAEEGLANDANQLEIAQFAERYCQLILRQVADATLAGEIELLIAETLSSSEYFAKIQAALEQMRRELRHASDRVPAIESDLAGRFDTALHATVLARVGAFWPMTLTDATSHAGFLRAARKVAADCLSEVSAERAQNTLTSFAGLPDPIQQARPMMQAQPGDFRWLLTGPSPAAVEAIAARIEKQFGARPTLAPSPDGSITLYCEVDGLPLENIVAKVVGNRTDLIEPSQRLRTRSDIEWCC